MRIISEQKVSRADVGLGWSSRTMVVSRVLGGILFSFALFSASAATWYVDSSVGTSGNGTAWSTAWQALSNVTGVKAGDTVYISGGASGSSQTYPVSSWKPAGGAAGNPITYQIGQDSAHNGTAIFSGSGTWFGGANYVIVSGNAGDGAMHFSCTGYGTAASINGNSNLRISYVNLGSNLSDGMDGQNVGSFELDHSYAFISDVGADHFFSVGFNGTTWDQNLIHDNTVYCPHLSSNANGADFFQIGGSGYTLYNNLLVGYNASYTAGQHQDGLQTLDGSFIKVYGNTFLNIQNFCVFGDAYYGGFSSVHVYNNVFISASGAVFGTDGGYQGPLPCTFNDIVIANNTFDCPDNGGQPIALNNVSSFATTFTNCVVANNVIVNGGGIQSQGDTTSTFVDNVSLTTAQGKTDFVGYTSGSTTNNDYHLLAAAGSLIGQGANESGYFATDKDGNARPASGNWDIGAYEYTLVTTPVILVTPGNTSYGTVLTGTSVTNGFTVKNIGVGTLTGAASVEAPFSIVSGGSYSLGAGQTQAVLVAFSPTVASNYSQTVTLTGGGGTNAIVSGTVATALAKVQFQITPAKQFILTVAGQTGHMYDIQATQDFITWTVIGTVTMGASGTLDFTDTNAASFSKRFYRIRE
jgi:hypothetical protein